ncbi:MAG TPA: hypothetical protein VK726_01615 [Acetobacteraceae bacterium]|jgi:hypothetical protein|nr:hypothetical protein [Acetobacteraceae bacterium]
MNDAFTMHELASDMAVQVTRSMPDLPAALDARMETLWRNAFARVAAGGAGELFTARVCSADTISPTAITGHVTEFRRIVAQIEDPALFEVLSLRPLAVSGVVRCADGVPVGRRHPAAIYQPGMWQLPPAGGVDPSAIDAAGRVDSRAPLLHELEEELGISGTRIDLVRPLCAVEHPGSHVTDIGMLRTTELTGAQVPDAHRRRGNTEYDPLLCIPFNDLSEFLTNAGADLVPPAAAFRSRAGLLATN